MSCTMVKTIEPRVAQVIEEFPQKTVGGQLVYRYGRAAEDPLYSTWLSSSTDAIGRLDILNHLKTQLSRRPVLVEIAYC